MDRRFRSLFTQAAFVLASAITLSSCMSDTGTIVDPDEGVPVVISLNPVATDIPATRAGYHDSGELGHTSGFAPGRDPEDLRISHLRVLLYDANHGTYVDQFECDVTNSNPIDMLVRTGKYDMVFIANADHNGMGTPGDRFMDNFFATPSNYNTIGKLDNARLDAAAFASDKDVPMLNIVRDVVIKGQRMIEVKDNNGNYVPIQATPANPWNPTLTRVGVRLSVSITMSEGQFNDWIASTNTHAKKIYIANMPADSYLMEGGNNGESTTGRGERTYTAVATTVGSGGAPVVPTGAEGYYWLDNSGSEPKGRARFDRIILPELMFGAVNTASKALELKMNLGGMGGDLKALLSQVAEPETAPEGYVLPRNLWLHLDGTVAENKLRVYPDPHPWDRAIIEAGIIGKVVRLEASSNPVNFSGFTRGTFTATTNNKPATPPASNITAVTTTATADWITGLIVTNPETNTSTGMTKSTVVVEMAYNDTGVERSTVIEIKTGNVTLPVTIVQATPVSYAAPGVIGYIADGPRKGELTILGSKEYAGTPLVGFDGRALATGKPLENETVHAALFKWGSLIALSSDYYDSSAASTWFDANDIIAAPGGAFGGVSAARAHLGIQTNSSAWANDEAIPFRSISGAGTFQYSRGWEPDPDNGLGDPCQYYFGGDWFMPSGGIDGWYKEGGAPFGNANIVFMTPISQPGNNYPSWPTGTSWVIAGDDDIWISGVLGRKETSTPDWSMFLPAIGNRDHATGQNSRINDHASYWNSYYNSNIVTGHHTNIKVENTGNFDSVGSTTNGQPWAYGVRCVETPGVRVPRGVIGYIHNPGGPRHRELTLEGDKSYFATGEADQNQYTVYAAYFKFGSLIALDSSDSGLFAARDVVAAPAEYFNAGSQAAALRLVRDKVNAAVTVATADNPRLKWEVIGPMTTNVPVTTDPTRLAAGQGDPCAYWFDQVTNYKGGRWHLPSSTENIDFLGGTQALKSAGQYDYTLPGANVWREPGMGIILSGSANGTRLPFAGARFSGSSLPGVGTTGQYWSSEAPTTTLGYYLTIDHTSSASATASMPASNQIAATVRCVQPPPPPRGVHAAPGQIGYIVDGNRQGELSLRGSSFFKGDPKFDTPSIDARFGGLEDVPVYVAFFRWGSLVALSSDLKDADPYTPASERFDANDIVQAPSTSDGYIGREALKEQIADAIVAYPLPPQGMPDPVWDLIPAQSTGPMASDANTWRQGRGDPCEYYFDHQRKFRGGGWHMPSDQENFAFVGVESAQPIPPGLVLTQQNGSSFTDPRMHTFTGGTAQGLTYPAAGPRDHRTSPRTYGIDAYLMSSTSPMSGMYVFSGQIGWNYGGDGFAVRCEPRSAPPSEVKVGNVIWAGSNLADNGVFAPNATDDGAYFQWGSNVAYYANTVPGPSSSYTNTATEWPTDQNPCPSPWRIPTLVDFSSLKNPSYQNWSWVPWVSGSDDHGGVTYTVNNGEEIFFPNNSVLATTLLMGWDTGAYWVEGGTYFVTNNPMSGGFFGSMRDKYQPTGIRCVKDATP